MADRRREVLELVAVHRGVDEHRRRCAPTSTCIRTPCGSTSSHSRPAVRWNVSIRHERAGTPSLDVPRPPRDGSGWTSQLPVARRGPGDPDECRCRSTAEAVEAGRAWGSRSRRGRVRGAGDRRRSNRPVGRGAGRSRFSRSVVPQARARSDSATARSSTSSRHIQGWSARCISASCRAPWPPWGDDHRRKARAVRRARSLSGASWFGGSAVNGVGGPAGCCRSGAPDESLLSLAIAVTFVWLGMVLAISFLEAPLKFRSPRSPFGSGWRSVAGFSGRSTVIELILAAVLTFAILIDVPPAPIVFARSRWPSPGSSGPACRRPARPDHRGRIGFLPAKTPLAQQRTTGTSPSKKSRSSHSSRQVRSSLPCEHDLPALSGCRK